MLEPAQFLIKIQLFAYQQFSVYLNYTLFQKTNFANIKIGSFCQKFVEM